MRWEGFAAKCPEIATLGEERFRRDELLLIGSLRKDGWQQFNSPTFKNQGDCIQFVNTGK